MSRLLVLSAVSLLAATSANANHTNNCDPSDKDCVCHFEEDLTDLESDLLIESLPIKNKDCILPVVDRSNKTTSLVENTPVDNNDDDNDDHDNGDDNGDGNDDHDNSDDSNDDHDNDNDNDSDHDNGNDNDDGNDDDDHDNGHGNDDDRDDDSNPGKGHGHGRNNG